VRLGERWLSQPVPEGAKHILGARNGILLKNTGNRATQCGCPPIQTFLQQILTMGGSRWAVHDGRFTMGGSRWAVHDGRFTNRPYDNKI